jgi:RNA polymerase sigma-70 factor (ECF subfamily)
VNDDTTPITAAQIADVARTHARLLYRVAYGIVRNAQVAEDVCQGALLKLVDKPSQVRNWQQVRAWLIRSVSNGALEHVRRRKVEANAARTLRPAEAAEREADDFLLREKLLEKVDELEPDLREVVVLRVMEGLSGGDVQQLLGLSAADVSRRMHAGLNRLRAALRERDRTQEELV